MTLQKSRIEAIPTFREELKFQYKDGDGSKHDIKQAIKTKLIDAGYEGKYAVQEPRHSTLDVWLTGENYPSRGTISFADAGSYESNLDEITSGEFAQLIENEPERLA